MDQCDVAVIGAGVVGLAIARALALAGREVVIVEQESRFGSHTSSRNSEVIHAGLYYPTGSLKARFCVEGSRRLYAYCEQHRIEHRRCGKLVVGQGAAQARAIEAIARLATANGVDGVELLSGTELRRIEPELRGEIGLRSSATGIVDSHGLMLSLLGEATANGAVIAYNSRATFLAVEQDHVELALNGEPGASLSARLLINAGGLTAPDVARAMRGFPAEFVPRSWLARGAYFTLAGKAPFRHLVYPAPQEGGLGIHLTLDLAGQARFGPDVEWIEAIDYRFDESRAASFYDAIRAYWPGLKQGSLTPSFTGIRPKIAGPGMAAADFRIDGGDTHGVQPVINLFGIESPGLTSALAIADHVRAMALRALD
jgi:L-2-hydroxyglutarate oxidase LhgO